MESVAALPALRSGEWRRVEVGPLEVAAALAAISDVITTYLVLVHPVYEERNLVVVALADVSVPLAMAVFAAIAAIFVVVCWLSLGWLSTAAGTYTALALGSGGLNNALGLYADVWLLEALPGPMWVLIHVVLPPVALAVAIGWTRIVHGGLPWREVLVVVPASMVSAVLPPVLF